MNISNIEKHLDWEQYYNPNFNWNYWEFYHNNRLSEDFIREFQNKVNWNLISQCQHLSEDFIREFADKVDWHWVSQYQKLSEAFIEEFEVRVHWINILTFQDLSPEFKEKWEDKWWRYEN